MGIYSSKSWSLWDAVLSFVLTCEKQFLFFPSPMTSGDTEAMWGWRVLSKDGLENFFLERHLKMS
jgi:hypothetical protein